MSLPPRVGHTERKDREVGVYLFERFNPASVLFASVSGLEVNVLYLKKSLVVFQSFYIKVNEKTESLLLELERSIFIATFVQTI